MKMHCCSYGSAFDKGATAFDCAKIPGPLKAADSATLIKGVYGFCGGELGSIDNGVIGQTVCCKFHAFTCK